MKRNSYISDFILNILIVGITLYAVISISSTGLEGNMEGSGTTAFRYFTIDSNILCAITSFIMLVYDIKALKGNEIPQYAYTLKMIGTTAVTVTFITVAVFLGPIQGYGMMLAGANLFMHLITPLLAIISFIFMEKSNQKFGVTFLSVLPVFIYGSIYLYLVVFKKVWPDFYCFNSGMLNGLWYISYIVMILLAFGIAVVLYNLNRRKQK